MRGVGEQRAGEGDQLALARRELHAALADLGLDSVGQGGDELGRADRRRGGLDLLEARVRPAEGDVLADVPEKRKPSWGTMPSWPRSARWRTVVQVVPVDGDRSSLGVVEAWKKKFFGCGKSWNQLAKPVCGASLRFRSSGSRRRRRGSSAWP